MADESTAPVAVAPLGSPAPAPAHVMGHIATPNGVPAAPAPVPPAPVVGMMSLPADEVMNLYGIQRKFLEAQAASQAALDAKEAERLKVLGEKEGVVKALEEQKGSYEGKIAAKDQLILSNAAGATILQATAGVDWLSPDAMQDAMFALEREVEAVYGTDGKPFVRDKATGRPAADVIREKVAGDRFKHFRKASTAGGTGAPLNSGGTGPVPTDRAPTMLERIFQAHKEGRGMTRSGGTNEVGIPAL